MTRIPIPLLVGLTIAAAFLAYLTFPPNGYINASALGWMMVPLSILELPANMLGVLLSGNAHQPNSFAWYAGLFVTYWLILGALGWLVVSVAKKPPVQR